MIRWSWRLFVALVLVGMTVALGAVHFLIFHDSKDLFFYLALDIVFVPFQVLLVTIIIERLLAEREKQVMLHKLNMVIGAFFGETGTQMLRDITRFCEDFPELTAHFGISAEWTDQDYNDAVKFATVREYKLKPAAADFAAMRSFLLSQRSFLLGLLENPNLLEHERFTDLLWAVSHLTEELEVRPGFEDLPPSDIAHITADTKRALGLLIREWLAYMKHLKASYPYIYSLAIRTNPFNPNASPIVK